MNDYAPAAQTSNNQIATVQPNGMMPYTDPAAVAAAEAEKARIQAQYLVAISRPRSYEQSRRNILEACKRPAFAEKVEYRKPTGKDVIIGPSVRFAELALREWGNIDYSNTVIYDDDMTRRIKVVITDLQTNTSFCSSISMEKTVERKVNKGREVVRERLNSYGDRVYIVRATDDELMMKQNALVSKALRNEGLRLIPQEIIEEAISLSHLVLQNADKADMGGAKRKLLDAFAAIGIQPIDIEEYFQHPIDRCVPAEFADLRAIYNAVKSGEAKWVDFIKHGDDEESDPGKEALGKAKAKMEELKNKMENKKPEQPDAPLEPKDAPENAAKDTK